MKVVFGDVVERPNDATLEQGEGAFHGVRGDGLSSVKFDDVLLLTVVDAAMRELVLKPLVALQLISIDRGALLDVFQNRLAETLVVHSGHNHGTLAPLAAALHERQNGGFIIPTRLVSAAALLAAHVRFVNLHGALEQVFERAFIHGIPDAVAHEPRGFVGDSKHPVDLMGAYRLLAGAHDKHAHQPSADLHMAGLENGALGNGELLAALLVAALANTLLRLATTGFLALNPVALTAAEGASRNAIRPLQFL